MTEKFEQLSLGKAIVLHLFPGVVITLTAVLLATIFKHLNLPALFWLSAAIPLALIPTELGFLYYEGYKKNGRFSLDGILGYQRPLKFSQYLWMVPLTLFSMIALLIGITQIEGQFLANLFSWIPDYLDLNILEPESMSRGTLILFVFITSIFANIIGPIVEELYFRGYLLPRLAKYGFLGNLINTFLFAVYHFWTPSQIIQRTIGIIPLTLAAQKGNLNVAIWAHVLINSLLTTVPFVAYLFGIG